MAEEIDNEILGLTADIVAAHVSNNSVAPGEVSGLIAQVHAALSALGSPAAPVEQEQQPAVPIRSSVKHEYIVCLEDGKKLKMLKRYLHTNYKMTPDEYRAKWKLPRDYPMVAPAYAEQRRGLAQKIGLGRKKVEQAPVAPPAPAKAARKPRAKKEAALAAVLDAPVAVAKRGRPRKVKIEA